MAFVPAAATPDVVGHARFCHSAGAAMGRSAQLLRQADRAAQGAGQFGEHGQAVVGHGAE
ncbi:hypothetical protein [Streptomyces sp. NPDC056105]|uniref:hypothetical protein n=1 Tax=Streptomyces sp. NPDC056105 TaxID=3345714 RepID=UPI0035DE296C